MLDRLLAFSEALREAGVPLSVGENLDALRSLEHVDFLDKSAVRCALAATTVKSNTHRDAFDLLFELYFGTRPASSDEPPPQPADPAQFMTELRDALGSGDGGGLQELARRAVDEFGRVEDSPSGNLFFEYPVWRALDIGALARPPDDNSVESRVARAEFERRLAAWRAGAAAEVRRRVARRRGAEAVARYSVRPLPEDVAITTATADELERLRRSVRPLARKLATRLAVKHRRARHGRLDMRRTVRGSLSTGGVPFDLVNRKRAPHRPELVVLCDVSDSVARFARFSLMLVHALAWQFTKVRSFVFLETIDEVTRLFEHEDFVDAVGKINSEANVVRIDSHSNYGGSFEDFLERYDDSLTPRSTVLILGDARNNYRASRAEALKEIRASAHKTYWLNPEPRSYWDTGDSLATVYAACIDDMAEVRTLRQLERFIALRL
ncbi:MAG: vWA domain-containing protein [Actinomycetota bacterium]